MTIKRAFFSYIKWIGIPTLAIYSQTSFAIPNGSYIGALLGRANLGYSASNQDLSPASKDEDSFAWRVFTGYRFNPNLGLEAGYINWPEVKFKNVLGSTSGQVDIKQKSVDLMGTFTFPFDSAAGIYAEAGAACEIQTQC